MSEPAPEVQNGDTDKTVCLLQPALLLACSIDTFCRTFGKAMIIDDIVPSSSTPSTTSASTTEDAPKKGKGRDLKKGKTLFLFNLNIFLSLLFSLRTNVQR